MKIAIVGAGFTGLAAGLYFAKRGHKVVIFEKDSNPGGLAVGVENPKWDWTAEKHYHHFFTNDNSVLSLAKRIDHKIIVKKPKTSVYLNGKTYQLDSPLKVLFFPELSITQRLRMATVLGFLRYNPFWKLLEKHSTTKALPKFMGKKAYELIWGPQMVGKFGSFSDTISLAWFWARIKKRTTSLAYPEGGFLNFAQHISKEIEKNGGKIYFQTTVLDIDSKKNPQVSFIDKNGKNKTEKFDAIIITLPSFLFLKIAKGLPDTYINSLKKLNGLGAINLVLRLDKKFFNDSTYWLSICDTLFPFMAVVDHGNFMDKKQYNNEHIIYVGKYLPLNHKYFKLTKQQLLEIYNPYLKKINPNYKKSLIDFEVYKAPFAQPIIPVNYSKIIPSFDTTLKNVYLANIEQVYPWDRGTNYAVELGEKIAKKILNENI